MPIKHDESGKRWVEMELLVPGTPEEVWQAMATGPGNTAWFAQTQIEERVGGVLRFDFGPNGSSIGEVVTWLPPTTFGYVEREWSEGAPPVATEITITARSGDRCVVRMVHSLFTSSDAWDDQVEGFENGWPGFFEVLRVYLAHYAGRKAAQSFVMVSTQGEQAVAWKRLADALGIAGASVGDQCMAPSSSPGFASIVEHLRQDAKQRFAVLRIAKPAPGIALVGTYPMSGKVNASLYLYFYGDDAEATAAAHGLRWDACLREAVMAN